MGRGLILFSCSANKKHFKTIGNSPKFLIGTCGIGSVQGMSIYFAGTSTAEPENISHFALSLANSNQSASRYHNPSNTGYITYQAIQPSHPTKQPSRASLSPPFQDPRTRSQIWPATLMPSHPTFSLFFFPRSRPARVSCTLTVPE